MKKNVVTLVAVLCTLLLFIRCSNDDNAIHSQGDEVTVKLELNIPHADFTRAGEGPNSALGGLHNVDESQYKLRYTIAYAPAGSENYFTQTVYREELKKDTPKKVEIKLLKGDKFEKFNIHVWADFVLKSDGSASYDLTGFPNKVIQTDPTPNKDAKDAYYCSTTFSRNENPIKISLKRPLAKVRYITTDYDVISAQGFGVKKIENKWEKWIKVYDFLILENSYGNTHTAASSENFLSEDGELAENEKAIFWDYIFVPSSGEMALKLPKFTIKATQENEVSTTIEIGEIDLRDWHWSNNPESKTNLSNKLITIKQDGFTTKGELIITIDDDFDSELTEKP